MSRVQSFTFKKFSKFVINDTDAPGEANTWYHYPQRNGFTVSFLFLHGKIDITIYYLGETLEHISLDSFDLGTLSFFCKWPSIGGKILDHRRKTLKRFQLTFSESFQFEAFIKHAKQLKIKIRESEHQLQSTQQSASQICSQVYSQIPFLSQNGLTKGSQTDVKSQVPGKSGPHAHNSSQDHIYPSQIPMHPPHKEIKVSPKQSTLAISPLLQPSNFNNTPLSFYPSNYLLSPNESALTSENLLQDNIWLSQYMDKDTKPVLQEVTENPLSKFRQLNQNAKREYLLELLQSPEFIKTIKEIDNVIFHDV